jgi:hypothetical protein
MRTRPAVRLCAVLLAAVGCDRFQTADTDTGPVASAKPWLIEKPFKKTGGETAEREAVYRVLEADRDHYRAAFATLKPDSKPSEAAKMIEDFHNQMEKVDTGGCPKDFLSARALHAKAWRKLLEAIKPQPDPAYEDTDFMDAMHALFQGDESGGKTLGGDMAKTVARVKKTYTDVFESAQKFGVEVKIQ